MGKSKKKLAVLLAATMTLTMMCGMTTFAEESDVSDPTAVTEPAAVPEPVMVEPTTPEPVITEPAVTPEPAAPTQPDTIPEPTTPDEPDITTQRTTPGEPDTAAQPTTPEEPDTTTQPTTPEEPSTATDPDITTEPDTSAESDVTDPAAESDPVDDPDAAGTETDDTQEIIEEEDTTAEEDVEDDYIPVEEPESSVWIGTDNEKDPYVELDQSDEFISLGEGKGSYKYTDGNLVLKDVNIELGTDWLPGFDITGTIVINLQGNNNIATKGDGINVYNGDLTINGDGTLTIKCTGDVGDGIFVSDGSLTIDGAKVTISTETKYGSDAITVYDGDINIINGADVTANAKVTGEETKYASVYGIHAYNGKINIKDSNVTANADGKISLEGKMDDWVRQLGIGIYSESSDIYPDDPYLAEYARPAGITIDNSNVNASGSFAAMLVIGKDGTITIKDSTIITPDDVNIRELMGTIEDDPDAAAVQIGAILAKGEGAVDLDAIMEEYYRLLDEGDDAALAEFLTSILDNTVKEVKIVRDSELVTAEKSMIPRTGDSFNAETLLLVLAVSGCICAYLIRKKVIA
ncbi:hypothetical protein H6B11_12585 [Mediterraneibacter glycyrrhizinilyticus]|nr:hypothetical protein [Mediterraneibacter glycyrrhizinilyticus]MBM6854978.1 hypothetical protein [Mediterraneibacter glycyrrhizinilyticus]